MGTNCARATCRCFAPQSSGILHRVIDRLGVPMYRRDYHPDMSETFDVIVAGLGGMGSAAAYHLAARGKRVLGVDQFSPPHDKGSSHGKNRVFRQAYYEDPSYVPLLLRAYELWSELDSSDRSLSIVTCVKVPENDSSIGRAI